MKKLKVILYNAPQNPYEYTEIIVEVFREKHDLLVYDEDRPVAEQFVGRELVLDVGGWGTREMIDAATDAKLWQILGRGTDHTDVDYIKSKGIIACNVSGLSTAVPLAECAMMHILMLARRFHEGTAVLERGEFFEPVGRSLVGLTLGLIGFGASAQELARRAKGFGIRIEATDVRRIEPEILDEIKPDFIGTAKDMKDVIRRSDFLSLHLPLEEGTHHLMNRERLAMMKPTACLINVARGALVDEEALYEALLEGRIGGAGLDVFAQEPPDMNLPVYRLPNVTLSPHNSGSTDFAIRTRAEFGLENANRLAQGLEPLHQVDT